MEDHIGQLADPGVPDAVVGRHIGRHVVVELHVLEDQIGTEVVERPGEGDAGGRPRHRRALDVAQGRALEHEPGARPGAPHVDIGDHEPQRGIGRGGGIHVARLNVERVLRDRGHVQLDAEEPEAADVIRQHPHGRARRAAVPDDLDEARIVYPVRRDGQGFLVDVERLGVAARRHADHVEAPRDGRRLGRPDRQEGIVPAAGQEPVVAALGDVKRLRECAIRVLGRDPVRDFGGRDPRVLGHVGVSDRHGEAPFSRRSGARRCAPRGPVPSARVPHERGEHHQA